MTVQELINALSTIEDKNLPVTIDIPDYCGGIHNMVIDGFEECIRDGYKIILLQ